MVNKHENVTNFTKNKCRLKEQCILFVCLGHWQRFNRLIIISADKGVGKQALLFTIGRSKNCHKL